MAVKLPLILWLIPYKRPEQQTHIRAEYVKLLRYIFLNSTLCISVLYNLMDACVALDRDGGFLAFV